MTAVIRVCSAGLQCSATETRLLIREVWESIRRRRRRERERKKNPPSPHRLVFFLSSPFTSPPLPPSFHCKWVWSLSDVIQLISLRFNYKRKHPSYPSPLDRGSTFSNKLPLVSQESLNYSFYYAFSPLSSPFVFSLSLSLSLRESIVSFSPTGLRQCWCRPLSQIWHLIYCKRDVDTPLGTSRIKWGSLKHCLACWCTYRHAVLWIWTADFFFLTLSVPRSRVSMAQGVFK